MEALTFTLDENHFCMDIKNIQEIRSYSNLTKIPDNSLYTLGVLNIRGKALEVYDIKKLFGYGAFDIQKHSIIITLDISGHEIGIVVDSVSELIQINDSEVSKEHDKKFVHGVFFKGDMPIVIINSDAMLKELS